MLRVREDAQHEIVNVATLPLHTVVFLLPFGIGKNGLFFSLPAGQGAWNRILTTQTSTGVVPPRVLGQYAYLACLAPGFGQLFHPLPGDLVHDAAGSVLGRGLLATILVVHLEGIQFLAQLGVRFGPFLIE